jgi:hypothetical protein
MNKPYVKPNRSDSNLPVSAQAILVRARHILSKPEHWTKYALAKNEGNWEVKPNNSTACKFCTIGALHRAVIDLHGGILTTQTFEKAKTALRGTDAIKAQHEGIVMFNDDENTTHQDVLNAFDEAIANYDQYTKE